MTLGDTFRANLLAPLPLAFALGVVARRMKSELRLPAEMYAALSVYLLFALGLKGGVELSHATLSQFVAPAGATLLLGFLTPVAAFFILRASRRFHASDAAGIAAHYGSVSAVTFIAAQQFLQNSGVSFEGFMPTLLALLESPGLHVAIAIGIWHRNRTRSLATVQSDATPGSVAYGYSNVRADATALDISADLVNQQATKKTSGLRETVQEVMTGRTIILLVGGLLIGVLMGDRGWKSVSPFFDTGFKGALMLFLLEMGVVAGARLEDLRKVGGFLVAFAVLIPIVFGTLGAWLGVVSGLSLGGATILAAMAASASYIAAPPAVRMTLPEANPTYSLVAALAITFPFNLLFGIPLYYQIARILAR